MLQCPLRAELFSKTFKIVGSSLSDGVHLFIQTIVRRKENTVNKTTEVQTGGPLCLCKSLSSFPSEQLIHSTWKISSQERKNIKQKLDSKLVICAPDHQATACTERPVCRQKSRHLIDWPIKEYTRLWQDGHANVGPLLTQQ